MKSRALFILKQREDYSTDLKNFNSLTVSTGMYNSAKFVVDMLNDADLDAKIAVVVDNNDIDREVTAFKPTHVFIEGLWVVPEKFDVLKPLHPKVKWIVRCHSELPFLSQEGIALNWIFEYFKKGVAVSGNSPRINRELRVMAHAAGVKHCELDDLIPLLPNFYPVTGRHLRAKALDSTLNIGCFGAFRPLKNHLTQALAAIEFAEQKGYSLNFHVNSGRVEMNGSNPLKNLRALFNNLPQHTLVEHAWASHDDFLKLINEMDLCMQVSFTETFNIVTADAVNQGVPVLVSREVTWTDGPFADPTSTTDMVEKMNRVLINRHFLIERNRENLKQYSRSSKKRWVNFLSGSKLIGFGRMLFLDLEDLFQRF